MTFLQICTHCKHCRRISGIDLDAYKRLIFETEEKCENCGQELWLHAYFPKVKQND